MKAHCILYDRRIESGEDGFCNQIGNVTNVRHTAKFLEIETDMAYTVKLFWDKEARKMITEKS